MILFENGIGIYGGTNTFCYENKYVAEDFLLQSASVINKVTILVQERDGITYPLEEIKWKIYLDNGGGVGSEIFSGNVTEFTKVFNTYDGEYLVYSYSFNLPNISLTQGIYWLGMRAFPAQLDFHWTIPSSGAYRGVSLKGNSVGASSSYGTPDSSDFHQRFKLEGSDAPVFDASFTVTPDNGIHNTTFTFTDMSTGSIISWMWSFGDGTTSTVQNPTHKYSAPGVYEVTLIISTETERDSYTRNVIVFATTDIPTYRTNISHSLGLMRKKWLNSDVK